MTFKSPTQPLCRYCGEAIKKTTVHVEVKPAPTEYDRPADYWKYHYGRLLTRADCQKVTNYSVSFVEYRYATDQNFERTGEREVAWFSTWDGESYEDQFFCKGRHAEAFARVMARAGHETVACQQAKRAPGRSIND